MPSDGVPHHKLRSTISLSRLYAGGNHKYGFLHEIFHTISIFYGNQFLIAIYLMPMDTTIENFWENEIFKYFIRLDFYGYVIMMPLMYK